MTHMPDPHQPPGRIAERSPEEILRAREPIGWRLGLERMRRLCLLLGMPQHRFASIHVVGTNGKTSVARMTMALLEAHGVSAGAYVSPHISSWRERILIGGEPISVEAFASAIERADQAAQVADRSAGQEGPVTQFELDTAAAFLVFAQSRVRWAVIEAGLGGRLDATNVIPSQLTVLTSVGLDHTEWLGETLEAIAAEKLAVLRDHTALITGLVPAEVEPVIEREVEGKHAAGRHDDGWDPGRRSAGRRVSQLPDDQCRARDERRAGSAGADRLGEGEDAPGLHDPWAGATGPGRPRRHL